MQAIRVHKPGDIDVLTFEVTVPIPEPKDDEVQIAIHAAGLNYIDTYHRSGLYPLPLPFIPGREGAGTISKIGKDVADFKVGDRVAFFGSGTYAQYATSRADQVYRLPENVDFADGAGILLQGVTAQYLTNSTYPVQQGDWVLVHAAAGGTGGLIVEMAKLKGARVIATVGSAEKATIAKQLGADVVIDYTKQDFLEEVKKVTEGALVRAVYDGVGAATWEKSLKCVGRRGYLVVFGNASGPIPVVDPLLLNKQGSIYLTRPTMVDYVANPEEARQRVGEVFTLLGQKKIHLRIAKTFPLSQARAAQTLLTSREAAGKILLLPS